MHLLGQQQMHWPRKFMLACPNKILNPNRPLTLWHNLLAWQTSRITLPRHCWHHRIPNYASHNTCKSFWLSDLSHPKHTRRRDKTYSFNSVVFRSVINSRFVFRGVFLLWAFTSALYITCLINGCVVFSLKSPRVSAFKLFFIKFIHSNWTALTGVLFSRFNPRFAVESSISCYISSPFTLFSVLCPEWRFEVMRYWALRNRFLP